MRLKANSPRSSREKTSRNRQKAAGSALDVTSLHAGLVKRQRKSVRRLSIGWDQNYDSSCSQGSKRSKGSAMGLSKSADSRISAQISSVLSFAKPIHEEGKGNILVDKRGLLVNSKID